MRPIYFTEHASPLGQLTLAATNTGLCGCYFFDQRNFKGAQDWQRNDLHPLLQNTAQQLDDYFRGQRRVFDLPLDLQILGTPFQQAVWNALIDIPFGATSTYGRHASLVNKPLAVRAVGGAIGRNPISIIVPCHRVIGKTGALTGYDGGLERKQFLLRLEGVL